MLALAQWLSDTRLSFAIREFDWLVPLLQTVHILAIAMVMSSIFLIALRMLRVTRTQPLMATTDRFLPWIWSGLVLLALSGALLIVGEPLRALPNPAFQIKMLLLALAIALTGSFAVSLHHDPARWDRHATTASRLLAVASLALWCAIAFAGRLIAYTQPI
jgi:hypothetical protein